MQGQVINHQKTVNILQWELSNGQDADLQRLAADALPSVLHHLERAQAIMGELHRRGASRPRRVFGALGCKRDSAPQ